MSGRIRFTVAAAAALGTTALAAAALTLAMTGSAMAGPTATASSARGTFIGLRRTHRFGSILVDAHGFTVYAFSRDSRDRDRCVAISNCPQVWPLITTRGRPRAGHGVKRSLLGTIRVGRRTQVTYAGHPLYGYAGDSSPGSTGYVGISQSGGVWRAVSASGRLRG